MRDEPYGFRHMEQSAESDPTAARAGPRSKFRNGSSAKLQRSRGTQRSRLACIVFGNDADGNYFQTEHAT